jgi:hypothetical protein
MEKLKHLASLFFVMLAVAPLAASAQTPNACIHAWGEARYGTYGYNHLVHIANTCTVDADCVVSTDVNPEPTSVEVPAKTEVVVNTFFESPSRVFTPRVTCTMHGK